MALDVAYSPVLHCSGSIEPVRVIALESGNYRLEMGEVIAERELYGPVGLDTPNPRRRGRSALPFLVRGDRDSIAPGLKYGMIDTWNVAPDALKIMRARFLLTRDHIYRLILEDRLYPWSVREALVARFFGGGVFVPEGSMRDRILASLQKTGFADGSIPVEVQA